MSLETITEFSGNSNSPETDIWASVSAEVNTRPQTAIQTDAINKAASPAPETLPLPGSFQPLQLFDSEEMAPGSDDTQIASLSDNTQIASLSDNTQTIPPSDKTRTELERGATNRVTLSDGRVYDVYVPSNADPDKPMPVVVAAHGAVTGDPSKLMETETGFSQMAEENGFIVAYPLAKVRTQSMLGVGTIEGAIWNTPYKDLNEEEDGTTYDDLEYVDELLADLKSRPDLNIDEGRIYATGFSDGARMLQLYAVTRPGTFAALSSVHGTLLEPIEAPSNGLPVMIVHGTSDDSLPLNGGKGILSHLMAITGVLPGTDTSDPRSQFKLWAEANGAPADGKEELSYEIRDGQVIGVTSTVIGVDGPVKQTIIAGADHAWHGRDGDGGHMPLGAREMRYQTSREVWDFMSAYRRHDGIIQSSQTLQSDQ